MKPKILYSVAGRAVTILLSLTLFIPILSAEALVASAPSITVLPLPEPVVSNIDPSTGIVTLALPDIDPEIRADLRAVIFLFDADGENAKLLESAEVKVTDPTDIKIPLRTKMQAGYKISPVLRNNDVESSGIGGINKDAAPSGNINSGSGSGNSKTRTVYIVTEATPEQIIIEETVEKLFEKIVIAKTDTVGREQEGASNGDDSDGIEESNGIAVIPRYGTSDSSQESSSRTESKYCNKLALFLIILLILLCVLLYIKYRRALNELRFMAGKPEIREVEFND